MTAMVRKGSNVVPRPFLKWVGGKGQLLGELVRCVDEAGPFRRYFEPFVGGGALFFELYRTGRLKGAAAELTDSNGNLIEAYQGLRDRVEEIIALLHRHKAAHDKEHYYAVRAHVPDTLEERAARIIYLNRTCFNGLYRENSRGGFNVPMGRYKDPEICNERNLRAVSAALANVVIDRRPFEDVAKRARKGNLIYFDPPYHPVSQTSYFTSYGKLGFGEADQRRLADLCGTLDRKGVRFLLSNSDTPFIQDLYRNFQVEIVYAARNVNSKADRRGKIREVLVRNF